MQVLVSQFERADGIEPKVFFSQKITCCLSEVLVVARRFMQTAMLRGEAADVVRIFDDLDIEIFRWDITKELSLLAMEFPGKKL